MSYTNYYETLQRQTNKNKFEKVSYNEFKKAVLANPDLRYNGESITSEEQIKKIYEEITLPHRATSQSAGYDIYTPFDINLTIDSPKITLPVGVRVALSPTNFFSIAPRSGIGTKTGYHLTNTIGIIDADYYNAENEGHIYVSLERGFKDLTLKPHDRFCQGVIMKYETTIDDDVTQKRTGGLGSTAK